MIVYLNDVPGLNVTYFLTRSNFDTLKLLYVVFDNGGLSLWEDLTL